MMLVRFGFAALVFLSLLAVEFSVVGLIAQRGDGSFVQNWLFETLGLATSGALAIAAAMALRLAAMLRFDRFALAPQHLWLFWLFIAVALLLQLASGTHLRTFSADPLGFTASLVTDLGVGFREEAWFRVFALLLMLKLLGSFSRSYGVVATVLIAQGLLFGLWHLINLLSGMPPALVATQVIYAANLGIILGVMTLMLGSVWPAVVAHGVFDIGVSYGDLARPAGGGGPTPDVSWGDAFFVHGGFIALTAILAFMSLIHLRKHGPAAFGHWAGPRD